MKTRKFSKYFIEGSPIAQTSAYGCPTVYTCGRISTQVTDRQLSRRFLISDMHLFMDEN